MQVAITLPDDDLDEIDALVPGEFKSRAEAVRVAVRRMLDERRAGTIDAAYRRGYEQFPPSTDEIDSGAARPTAPHPWDDLEW